MADHSIRSFPYKYAYQTTYLFRTAYLVNENQVHTGKSSQGSKEM